MCVCPLTNHSIPFTLHCEVWTNSQVSNAGTLWGVGCLCVQPIGISLKGNFSLPTHIRFKTSKRGSQPVAIAGDHLMTVVWWCI